MKLATALILLKSFFIPVPHLDLRGEGPVDQPRCFQTSQITVRYIIEDFNSFNEYGPSGDCALEFEARNNTFSYFMRRTQGVAGCKLMVRDWQRLLRGSKYICIYGSPTVDRTYDGEKMLEKWAYEKLVTDRGCDSYSDGGCAKSERIRISSR